MYLFYTAASTFFVSLLGSLHCLMMCGGFAGFCATTSGSPRVMSASYHIGRLISYATLGAIAGLMGTQLDKAGFTLGITWLSGFFVGIVLVVSGLIQFVPTHLVDRFWNWLRGCLPAFPSAHTSLVKIATRHPRRIGLVFGISSSLLPCGWLYTFVILAGSMGGPLQGIIVMSSFWMGTLPILMLGAGGVHWIFARIGGHAKEIAAFCMVCAGVVSLLVHLSIDSNVMTSCH